MYKDYLYTKGKRFTIPVTVLPGCIIDLKEVFAE